MSDKWDIWDKGRHGVLCIFVMPENPFDVDSSNIVNRNPSP